MFPCRLELECSLSSLASTTIPPPTRSPNDVATHEGNDLFQSLFPTSRSSIIRHCCPCPRSWLRSIRRWLRVTCYTQQFPCFDIVSGQDGRLRDRFPPFHPWSWLFEVLNLTRHDWFIIKARIITAAEWRLVQNSPSTVYYFGLHVHPHSTQSI